MQHRKQTRQHTERAKTTETESKKKQATSHTRNKRSEQKTRKQTKRAKTTETENKKKQATSQTHEQTRQGTKQAGEHKAPKEQEEQNSKRTEKRTRAGWRTYPMRDNAATRLHTQPVSIDYATVPGWTDTLHVQDLIAYAVGIAVVLAVHMQ